MRPAAGARDRERLTRTNARLNDAHIPHSDAGCDGLRDDENSCHKVELSCQTHVNYGRLTINQKADEFQKTRHCIFMRLCGGGKWESVEVQGSSWPCSEIKTGQRLLRQANFERWKECNNKSWWLEMLLRHRVPLPQAERWNEKKQGCENLDWEKEQYLTDYAAGVCRAIDGNGYPGNVLIPGNFFVFRGCC